MFKTRSSKLERIDTGDYTAAEYERFLLEIAFINRYLGDGRALRGSLLKEVRASGLSRFSVLDVGAGSGELLRAVSAFASRSGREVHCVGLDLNEISAKAIKRGSAGFDEISVVRADALCLPFADRAFDYAMCSLFAHHLTDDRIITLMREMKRVSRGGVFVIDLHRHRLAYAAYKIFCFVFRISPLVTHDGSLSILRGFKPEELRDLAERAGLREPTVMRRLPFRLVLRGD